MKLLISGLLVLLLGAAVGACASTRAGLRPRSGDASAGRGGGAGSASPVTVLQSDQKRRPARGLRAARVKRLLLRQRW